METSNQNFFNNSKSQKKTSNNYLNENLNLNQSLLFCRIAIYDNLKSIPKIIDLKYQQIENLLTDLPQKVYMFSHELGGHIPYTILKEVIENLIHANFQDITISILDNGNFIIISDHGPGIIDKEKAFLPGYTSATNEMKKYIRGVGSGLPIVKETIHFCGGIIEVQDNINHGTVVCLKMSNNINNTANTNINTNNNIQNNNLRDFSDIIAVKNGTINKNLPILNIPYKKDNKLKNNKQFDLEHINIEKDDIISGNSVSNNKTIENKTIEPSNQIDIKEKIPNLNFQKILKQIPNKKTKETQDTSKFYQYPTNNTNLNSDKVDRIENKTKENELDKILPLNLTIRQKKILSLMLELEECGPAKIAKELGFSLSTSYRDLVFLERIKLLESASNGKRKLSLLGKKYLEYYLNSF